MDKMLVAVFDSDTAAFDALSALAKAEMASKLKALQDQAKGVGDRAKARIERRIADLKANFDLRSSKLSQASTLTNDR